jgi:phosphoribosylformylglycinamidine cyclo-ligase
MGVTNSGSEGRGKSQYKKSGVDIDKGNIFADKIRFMTKHQKNPAVLSELSGFASVFDISEFRYKNPVLVSSTDGVGSKMKLADQFNQLDTIGIDLVAMNVNDIICCGARPLFFLDYYATGKLDIQKSSSIISGIINGCDISDIPLVGGETSEMRSVYHGSDFDIAGFVVGIAEKESLLSKNNVTIGDAIIGIFSSGPHSNGYSLINQLVKDRKEKDPSIIGMLLKPTRIYVSAILGLIDQIDVKSIAHITGGGISENLLRVLPDGTTAHVDLSLWDIPEIFKWINKENSISQYEMLRIFNCGIGMIVIVDPEDENDTINILNTFGESALKIGNVIKSHSNNPQVIY